MVKSLLNEAGKLIFSNNSLNFIVFRPWLNYFQFSLGNISASCQMQFTCV